MALDLIEELERIVVAFEDGGIQYALCGGLALAAHGHPRMTMDIDLLIRAEQLPSAIALARNVGFDVPARKMIFGLRTATPREVQRLSKIDPDTGGLLSLDLLVVAFELEDVWNGRIVAQWLEREIVIVSREGLATMKRLAGRPQDLADIDVLERTSEEDE